jgi:hypothetical protein
MDNRSFRADDRLNQFNDQDEMWGPLLFLRPQRQQPMSLLRVLALAGSLGTFYGMLGNVILGLLSRASGGTGKPSALMMPLLLTAVYFVCAQLSIVGAWNRRAHLLSRQQAWSELTRRRPSPAKEEQTEQ